MNQKMDWLIEIEIDWLSDLIGMYSAVGYT